MSLWLFNNQTTKRRIGILCEFAENHSHEDQIVITKPVTLNFKRIDNQGQTRCKLLKIACTQSNFENLSKFLAKHELVAAYNRVLRINEWRMLLQLSIEIDQSFRYPTLPCLIR